eukprot:CAMPEP_0195035048 /NCGR_PEP_ID=MMETSP0326_2-20130528/69228_1 /TAXON_ID=2866 ORGANISM="Crypthecodinium cohnii, Strain Seligo" /NCGR_SAMPLE_ID=MMETSP0326_2 /ASSEMBLY_ACC=CAM_ASM_000348 /LENGTH=41 /DNA_ID= /DNA_START= /DNA_END= /DNA_ORIENTATION=
MHLHQHGVAFLTTREREVALDPPHFFPIVASSFSCVAANSV